MPPQAWYPSDGSSNPADSIHASSSEVGKQPRSRTKWAIGGLLALLVIAAVVAIAVTQTDSGGSSPSPVTSAAGEPANIGAGGTIQAESGELVAGNVPVISPEMPVIPDLMEPDAPIENPSRPTEETPAPGDATATPVDASPALGDATPVPTDAAPAPAEPVTPTAPVNNGTAGQPQGEVPAGAPEQAVPESAETPTVGPVGPVVPMEPGLPSSPTFEDFDGNDTKSPSPGSTLPLPPVLPLENQRPSDLTARDMAHQPLAMGRQSTIRLADVRTYQWEDVNDIRGCSELCIAVFGNKCLYVQTDMADGDRCTIARSCYEGKGCTQIRNINVGGFDKNRVNCKHWMYLAQYRSYKDQLPEGADECSNMTDEGEIATYVY